MKAGNFAGAFLKYNGKALLLQRGLHKKIAPGMWSCIGGHIEPDEINDPEAACLREIEEETGILPSDIENLSLKYIMLDNTGLYTEGIEIIYFFTGCLKHECSLVESDEGTLHWVGMDEAKELAMSPSIKQIFSHWTDFPDCKKIMLCSVSEDNHIQLTEI